MEIGLWLTAFPIACGDMFFKCLMDKRRFAIWPYVISSPKDVAELLKDEMRYEKREIVKAIILNSKNIITKIVDVCYGGTNSAILKPKDVLQEAIKLGAPKIILVHNHPSGDPTPSKSDFDFTDRLLEASNIMGIEMLDHIVIGDCGFKSIFYLKSKNN